MKYLIMCEGSNELAVIKILLKHHLLKIKEDDLLGLVPYHARQIEKSVMVQSALNVYPGKVTVIRVGDKLGDALKIPRQYKEKIHDVIKVCTKPELEILLIISENLLKEYLKSKETPKIYAKKNVCIGKRKYKNDTSFYEEYFGNNPDKLVYSIREYKRIHNAHKKDELFLADYLL